MNEQPHPEPPPDACTCDYSLSKSRGLVRVGTKPGCPVHDK